MNSSNSRPLDVDAVLGDMVKRSAPSLPLTVSTVEYMGNVDLATRERRARAYARTLDPSFQGQNGSGDAFVAAMKIGRGFALSEETTFRILKEEFNARCVPPWSERELRHKVKTALKDGRMIAIGALLEELQPATPSETPTFADPLRGLQHLSKVAIRGRDAILALASKPISYIWDGITEQGLVNMLSSETYGGKTTLLAMIIASRANTGEPVNLLGYKMLPAPEGQLVVFVEGEISESSSSRKLKTACDLLGVGYEALDRVVIVARKEVRLGSKEWLDIVEMVRAGIVSDIVLDTLARVSPSGKDSNSEDDQIELFGVITSALESAPTGEPRPNAWVSAHLRKGGTGLDGVSGSNQRVAQVDTLLELQSNKGKDKRVESVTVTFPKIREPRDDGPAPLTYAIKKGIFSILSGGPEGADNRPTEVRVLEYLDHLGAATVDRLSKHLECHHTSITKALLKLSKDGLVLWGEEEIKGKTVRVYRAKDPALRRPTRPDCDGAPF